MKSNLDVEGTRARKERPEQPGGGRTPVAFSLVLPSGSVKGWGVKALRDEEKHGRFGGKKLRRGGAARRSAYSKGPAAMNSGPKRQVKKPINVGTKACKN